MGVVDNFLKKMKMVNEEDEYDDYDDYDDYEDDEEILPKKKPEKQKKTRVKERARDLDDDDLDDYDDFEEKVTAPQKPAPKKATYTQSSYAGSSSSYSQQRQNVVGMNRSAGAGPEVCMIMPKSFDDANTIAELLLERKAVVLNLEGIDMSAAQRIIDFASGACYTVGGNLQKISKKIFIVVPQNMNLSGDFDELMGDMVDLSALSGSL